MSSIVDSLETVLHKELDHCHKTSPLIPLLERVRLNDPSHQPDGQSERIILAVGMRILRTRQGAFQ